MTGCAGPAPVSAPPEAALPDRPSLPGQGAALEPGPVHQSNRDIADDFVDLVFHPEGGRELPRLLRFEGRIRVGLVGAGLAAHTGELEALLARVRREAGLDIARAERAEAAEIRVTEAPRRQMLELFPSAQCFVVPRHYGWGEFAIALRRNELPDWAALEALREATVFVPSAARPIEIRECFQEEIAQALGPANDLFRLPETVFNDDNVHANLTRFDMLILRVLYDPRLAPGMGREAARRAAREVLAEINPAGRDLARRRGLRPAPEWEAIMARLYRGGLSRAERRQALREALRIAETVPQPDHRLALTLDMLAEAEYAERPELSEGLLRRALDSLLAHYPRDDLRVAAIRLHLAQTKLRLGRPQLGLDLAEAALPVFVAYDEPLRIAQCYQLRAIALSALGRVEEARASALEGDRWARLALGEAWATPGPVRRGFDFLEALRLGS
ncbi:MAG TPA: DUF2927 domain-containing protein [Paracoccaceae bacterium]|nr:DUF2927 domain-containing protein [Paracoccaceae bacterium]